MLLDSFQNAQLGAKETNGWTIVDEFNQSYYSGLDVSVYFGGIFIEEITQLQFQEIEQVRPIYSYASYTPTVITHGTRLTQGSFVLNFKDASYMNALLTQINDKMSSSVLEQAINNAYIDSARSNTEAGMIPQTNAKLAAIKNVTQAAITKDLTLASIINMAKTDGNIGTQTYTELLAGMSSRYWVDSPVSRVTSKNMDETSKFAPKGSDVGFDIMVKYGQPEGSEPSAYGSIRVLRDCHLSGCQQVVDDSGRNIAESYTFICSSTY